MNSLASLLKQEGYDTVYLALEMVQWASMHLPISQGLIIISGKPNTQMMPISMASGNLGIKFFGILLGEKMDTFKQPFYTTLFTASSHHPGTVEHMKTCSKVGQDL
ncbi:MAG: hypothetical protein QM734_09535, partial [Cyclobacteriaceae bacterium]